MSLDEYLTRAVFYRPRSFTRAEFRDFIFAQSQPHTDAIEIARRLAAAQTHFMATINNEILELNDYRIEKFGLRSIFPIFFSSCFLGIRKPDLAIYQMALQVAQRKAEEGLFIDDREVNLECPRELGFQTILYQDASQLRSALEQFGITLST